MALKTFICGYSLETGTKTLAILAIIGNFYKLINLFFVDPQLQGYATHITYTGVVSTASMIAAAFLLSAIAQKKPGHLLPWLVVFVIELVADSIQTIYWIVSIPGYEDNRRIIAGSVLGIFIPFVVLGIYCWFVVYSYYKELKSIKKCKSEIKAFDFNFQ